MANLNKIDVPIAIEHKTKLDLSCDHVTSMGFMTTQPVNYRHMIKTEHISLNANSVIRPAPIEVPVYGMLRQNIRYFFVPYRLVFPNWDSFYNDVLASNYSGTSLVESPPILSNSEIIRCFTDFGLSVQTSEAAYDFSMDGISYKFTVEGRFLYKLLKSLGYEPLWSGKIMNVRYNGLALLAYAKVYIDWYANSQYLNSSDVITIEQMLKFNDPLSNLNITAEMLFAFLGLVKNVVYDTDDYYVNAWDNPVSPNSGQFTSFGFQDPTATGGAYVFTNVNGSPEMAINTQYPESIGTTYIHEALKRLTDFQKRHALAGARSIDRVLAQYGVVTDSLKQQRSIYIGNQVVNIEIGSVYATANGGAPGQSGNSYSHVGDYAGAGFGKGSSSVDFTADEEGVLLAIASIIPAGRLVSGYDRNNLHVNKQDFFVPEFDSLGVQAIEKGEVYVSSNGNFVSGDDSLYRGVFGFTGRYGEYKRPKSFLTGDFVCKSIFAGADSWHLFRMLYDSEFSGSVENLVHSLDFTRGKDSNQYYRIFQYSKNDYEPFYCFIHFDVASYAPCKPLFETYEFESDSKRVPTENGNKVN